MVQPAEELSPSNIRLLALLTEFFTVMSEYVHRFDSAKVKTSEPPVTNVIRTAQVVHEMKEARSVCCRFYVAGSLVLSAGVQANVSVLLGTTAAGHGPSLHQGLRSDRRDPDESRHPFIVRLTCQWLLNAMQVLIGP